MRPGVMSSPAVDATAPRRTISSARPSSFRTPNRGPTTFATARAVPPTARAASGWGGWIPSRSSRIPLLAAATSRALRRSERRNVRVTRSAPPSRERTHVGPVAGFPIATSQEPPPRSTTPTVPRDSGRNETAPSQARRPSSSPRSPGGSTRNSRSAGAGSARAPLSRSCGRSPPPRSGKGRDARLRRPGAGRRRLRWAERGRASERAPRRCARAPTRHLSRM